MTQDASETNRLLSEILSAIQSLDRRIQTQDRDEDNSESIGVPIEKSEDSRTDDSRDLLLKDVFLLHCLHFTHYIRPLPP